jgi:hypothetical protein
VTRLPDFPSENPPERLSVELRNLAASVQEQDLTFGELIQRLEGRVYTLLLVLLPLPFCQPIALPGLSTPFGVVIALLGLRFAFRQKPWLPKRVLKIQIPSKVLPAIMRGSAKLLGVLERLLHPRLTGLFDFRATQFAAGLTIFFCGMLLLLPLPVPFSNLLPALTVVLLAASVSERDGIMLAAGAGVFLITLGFYAGLFFGGMEVFDWLQIQIREFFAQR